MSILEQRKNSKFNRKKSSKKILGRREFDSERCIERCKGRKQVIKDISRKLNTFIKKREIPVNKILNAIKKMKK